MSAFMKKTYETILASKPSLTQDHNQLMVIMGCLALLSLLWRLLFTSSEWTAVGLNNPKAKKNRWSNVMLLHLSFIVSVWFVSPSSLKVKLYLTAIMLADPLTFGVYQFPRLQQTMQKVWQALEYRNDQLSTTLLKIFAMTFVISYKLRYDSVSAGLNTAAGIFLCYVIASATLISLGHKNKTAVADQAQIGDGKPIMQTVFADLRLHCRPRHIFKPPEPQDLEQFDSVTSLSAVAARDLSPPPNVQTQYNVKDTVEECLCAGGFVVIVTLSFIVLINALDDAQSNKLLLFSSICPQGFYSMIILPHLILSADFFLDMQMADKDHPEATSLLAFSIISFIILLANALLSNDLFLILGPVAWYASVAKHNVWKISQCYELLATSYSLLMVYNSFAWATVLGLPFFVTLFLF